LVVLVEEEVADIEVWEEFEDDKTYGLHLLPCTVMGFFFCPHKPCDSILQVGTAPQPYLDLP
jgi:hypothetical protein